MVLGWGFLLKHARGEGGFFLTVARGPVPREASARGSDGEGQARALRGRGRLFLTVVRGPVPREASGPE